VGVTDQFSPPSGQWYPKELGISVTVGQEITPVEVFVPVMDAIQSGSGTQLARLQLDWDSISLISGDIPDGPTSTIPDPVNPTDPAEPGDPGTSEPGTSEPDTGDPGTSEPGTSEPGTSEPGTSEPGTSEPGASEPGTTEPGTSEPGTSEPGTSEPGTSEPGTSEPGTSEPGATETAPVGDGQTSVDYTQSDDTVTLDLPEDKVNEIIDNAAGLVSIDLSGAADAAAAVLPKDAVTKLADASLAVEIKLPQGSVTLSPEAAKSAVTQAASVDISIELKPVAASSLNDRQQAAVGNAPVYDISLLSSGQYITEFGGGLITIALPYTLKAGENASGVAVWYLDDQGNIEKMNSMYDVRTQTAIFTTNHFSKYFVTYEAPVTPSGDGNAITNAGGGAVSNDPSAVSAEPNLLGVDEEETPQGAADVPGSVIPEEPVPQGVADPDSVGDESLGADTGATPYGAVGVPKTGGPEGASPIFSLTALLALSGCLTSGVRNRRKRDK
jgi:hypothetical protein